VDNNFTEAELSTFPDPKLHKDEILNVERGPQEPRYSFKSDGRVWKPIPQNDLVLKGGDAGRYGVHLLLNKPGLDPYIVVGVGRCGTSIVANILHNKLNICMGDAFDPDRNFHKSNPLGFWEDKEFATANKFFVLGKINFSLWVDHILYTAGTRKHQAKPWGFKDTRTSYLLGFYLSLFEKPRIIYCKRDKGLVVKSLVKNYGYEDEFANLLYDYRAALLDNMLNKVNVDRLIIDFDTRRVTDEEIISLIRNKWRDIDGP